MAFSDKNIISQFVEEEILQAFDILFAEDGTLPATNVIESVAKTLCAALPAETFSSVIESTEVLAEKKLTLSFNNNLKLLVEKTWVEPADATVKEQVLYRLEKLCTKLEERDYNGCYIDFISVLTDVVYLMFGSQAKKEDFPEYALRIDPEFGIFWWYVQSLPQKVIWPAEKNRLVMLLGMYFLANY
ncbi:MAG: hypothetical protein J6B81_00675 [Spirochaetaceae bacterium]|nr:hypothetical protein [Spirochaetaceae bacterium]